MIVYALFLSLSIQDYKASDTPSQEENSPSNQDSGLRETADKLRRIMMQEKSTEKRFDET